jgi:hypothetical protein
MSSPLFPFQLEDKMRINETPLRNEVPEPLHQELSPEERYTSLSSDVRTYFTLDVIFLR